MVRNPRLLYALEGVSKITRVGDRDMGRKKSWGEKLADSKDLPKVAEITEKMNKRWGG